MYVQFTGIVAAAQEGNVSEEREIHVNGEQPAAAAAAGIVNGHAHQFTKSLNFSGEKPHTPILDTINFPMHMKNLSLEVRNSQYFPG